MNLAGEHECEVRIISCDDGNEYLSILKFCGDTVVRVPFYGFLLRVTGWMSEHMEIYKSTAKKRGYGQSRESIAKVS